MSQVRLMIAALMLAGMNMRPAEPKQPIRSYGKPKILDFDIPIGSTANKYKPHQGKKEVARRLSKIKGGAA